MLVDGYAFGSLSMTSYIVGSDCLQKEPGLPGSAPLATPSRQKTATSDPRALESKPQSRAPSRPSATLSRRRERDYSVSAHQRIRQQPQPPTKPAGAELICSVARANHQPQTTSFKPSASDRPPQPSTANSNSGESLSRLRERVAEGRVRALLAQTHPRQIPPATPQKKAPPERGFDLLRRVSQQQPIGQPAAAQAENAAENSATPARILNFTDHLLSSGRRSDPSPCSSDRHPASRPPADWPVRPPRSALSGPEADSPAPPPTPSAPASTPPYPPSSGSRSATPRPAARDCRRRRTRT